VTAEEAEYPIVLTVQQAARLLQVSENHLYGLIAQGVVPHTRFGKLIRIPRWTLMQFIAQSAGTEPPGQGLVAKASNQSVDDLQPTSEEV